MNVYVECSGGINPCGEMLQNALDGNTVSLHGCANCNHKWLDFTRGDLIMTFESSKAVAFAWLARGQRRAQPRSSQVDAGGIER